MKPLVLILLVVWLAGCAFAEAIDVVKNTKNINGLTCNQIPQVIQNKLGYKDLVVNWLSDRIDGFHQVSLSISAQKEVQVDGMYMSYRWQPRWVWAVSSRDNNVRPTNQLALNWMAGKI